MTFRLRRGDTAEPLQRVNAEQRVLLAGTSIAGRYTGRICVLNHRTDRARVDEAIGAQRRHAATLSTAVLPVADPDAAQLPMVHRAGRP